MPGLAFNGIAVPVAPKGLGDKQSSTTADLGCSVRILKT